MFTTRIKWLNEHYGSDNHTTSKSVKSKNIKTVPCPCCGSQGEDLVFAFYCYNEKCKNYKKSNHIVNDEEDDLPF